jgi:acetylornithine/succinyldiaminopimelate/putrescine aminotransferase
VQFFSSGAEAVEAALKFAAMVTGRRTFLSLSGGFHGLTGIATALAGEGFWREGIATPLDFAETLPSLDPEIVRARLAQGDVAAVLLEPIQASAGSREQSAEHLAALSDACRDHGTLLIADEVASGIGRTGRWFGFQHWQSEFRPDMVVVSKGLTGALLPVSAVLCRNPVFDAVFGKGRAKIHGATMAGNPMSMVCASAVLAEAERIDACALAAEGERIFRAAMAEHDPAGDMFEISGRGLMLAVYFKTIPTEKMMALWSGIRDRNILMAPTPHRRGTFLMTPPLTVSAAQLQAVAAHLAEVVRKVDAEEPPVAA